MDIGSILILLSLAILVGLFISRPLFETTGQVVSQEEHDYSSLLAERERILNALQELDFDHVLGKVPEDEYPVQRAALMSQGATVLQQLDEIEKEVHSRQRTSAEDRIEAAIQQRKRQISPAKSAQPQDDDLEALIASRKRTQSEKTAGFCHKCGTPLKKVDQFCSKCGTPVPTE